jgi:glutamate dehydrogenase
MRRLTVYLARRTKAGEAALSIAEVVARYGEAVAAQRASVWDDMSAAERAFVEARIAALVQTGAPEDLAKAAALFGPMTLALDIADLARDNRWSAAAAARLFRVLGAQIGLDDLRAAASHLSLDQHWDRLVLRRTQTELLEDQCRLAHAAAKALDAPGKEAAADWAEEGVRGWLETVGAPAQNLCAVVAELEAQGGWSFAKILLAAAEVRELAERVK